MRKTSENMENIKRIVKKNQTICYVASRSGGHIIPCLTLAKQWKRKHETGKIIFFSTYARLDKELLSHEELITKHIPLQLANVPKNKYKLPLFLWQLGITFLQSIYHLLKKRPVKVISTGGYISIPVCLAAKLLHIPIELYELNVMPGKATKFLSAIADTLHSCFKETKNHLPGITCIQTAYPVKYTQKDKQISRKEALWHLKLDPAKKTVVILGGSQGSKFINNVIENQLKMISEAHRTINIIHQTGALMEKRIQKFYANHAIPAIVTAYQDDLKFFYAAADLVICRSGAGSLAEVIFFEKSCVTIPLETETNTHQVANAQAASKKHPKLIHVMRQKDIEAKSDWLQSFL